MNHDYHRDQLYVAGDPLFTNIFTKVHRYAARFTRPGRVLEIGSSVGSLLKIFRHHGWQVQGVEPSSPAAAAARLSGIPTLISTLEAVRLPPQYYHLAILNHVLEHLVNPQLALKKIHRHLKPGGHLLIGVPNAASLSARLLGPRWPLRLPLEHRWQFTPASLSKLLRQARFRPVGYYTDSGLLGLNRPLSEIAYSLLQRKKRFFNHLINLPLHLLETLTRRGQNLVIIARKT